MIPAPHFVELGDLTVNLAAIAYVDWDAAQPLVYLTSSCGALLLTPAQAELLWDAMTGEPK